MERKRKSQPGDHITFHTVYRHYRTGKLMYAEEYGYRAWPFGRRKRH